MANAYNLFSRATRIQVHAARPTWSNGESDQIPAFTLPLLLLYVQYKSSASDVANTVPWLWHTTWRNAETNNVRLENTRALPATISLPTQAATKAQADQAKRDVGEGRAAAPLPGFLIVGTAGGTSSGGAISGGPSGAGPKVANSGATGSAGSGGPTGVTAAGATTGTANGPTT